MEEAVTAMHAPLEQMSPVLQSVLVAQAAGLLARHWLTTQVWPLGQLLLVVQSTTSSTLELLVDTGVMVRVEGLVTEPGGRETATVPLGVEMAVQKLLQVATPGGQQVCPAGHWLLLVQAASGVVELTTSDSLTLGMPEVMVPMQKRCSHLPPEQMPLPHWVLVVQAMLLAQKPLTQAWPVGQAAVAEQGAPWVGSG